MNWIVSTITRKDFESLKENMQMYQSNIDNNITWFYMALAIVLAVLVLGLIYLVKASVSSGIQKGIEKVESNVSKEMDSFNAAIERIDSDFRAFDNQLDQRIIQLIENNSKIRWAKGSVNLNSGQDHYVGGLNGNIDWDSPLTSVRLIDVVNRRDIDFILVEKRENSFSFRLVSEEAFNYVEWAIVWSQKN